MAITTKKMKRNGYVELVIRDPSNGINLRVLNPGDVQPAVFYRKALERRNGMV